MPYSYDIAAEAVCQDEILEDVSSGGRVRPWREKKMANQLLASAYDQVDVVKAQRLRDCASWLRYVVQPDGTKRLAQANFCRVRLCPVCQWRRALKGYSQTRAILQDICKNGGKYRYVFLTLTMRNVCGSDLSAAIDQITEGFNRLTKYKDVAKVVKGYYRGIEITHNINPMSPSYDTFHPHIHMLAAVNPSYFTGRDYLSQRRWTELWARAIKADYAPLIDVRKCNGDTAASVAEVAKYAVKDSEYIIPDDWDLTIQTVELLDRVLAHRRFAAYGGLMKEAHRRLQLEDPEDGDLIHADEDKLADFPPEAYIDYVWSTGYKQYVKE